MRLAIAAALAFICIARPAFALPVSPHQLSAYTPYWQPRPHPSLSDCPPQICSPNEPQGQGGSPAELAELPSIKLVRRTNMYKTGWTMGGMPFSVLYMNPKPQISVRSPIADPLRSLPQIYDSELLQSDRPLADSPQGTLRPNPRVEQLTSTTHPTRRQYSIIPQLFVSYGWGPLSLGHPAIQINSSRGTELACGTSSAPMTVIRMF